MHSHELKKQAFALGFNLAGVIAAEPSPHLDAYLHWIERGRHGEMGYMARPDRVARRRDLSVILPGVRSLVLVGLDYRSFAVPDDVLADPARGRIASYAWGLDYHDIMTPRLEQLAAWLAEQVDSPIAHKVYVDTGAVLERSHAYQAGMGFVGKNTMLIHPRRGSYFFLGEILADIDFDDYDQPERETLCGTCTRCLTACPTDAFPKPFILDARRCISYLTIEHKGWIDRELRPMMGNWVFGCDVCQEICPWQRFTETTGEAAFLPDSADRAAPLLTDLLLLDESGFRARFDDSPVGRIGRDRLVRNACIAAGNGGDPQVIPYLIQLLYDASPLVRGHAAWALWHMQGESVRSTLTALYDRDTDDAVRAEIAALVG